MHDHHIPDRLNRSVQLTGNVTFSIRTYHTTPSEAEAEAYRYLLNFVQAASYSGNFKMIVHDIEVTHVD